MYPLRERSPRFARLRAPSPRLVSLTRMVMVGACMYAFFVWEATTEHEDVVNAMQTLSREKKATFEVIVK